MALTIQNPELEAIILERSQARGISIDEYLRECIVDEDQLQAVRLRELRQRFDDSLAATARGEGVNGEEFMAGLLAELDSPDLVHGVE